MMDEIEKENGFSGIEELNRMVANVDLTKPNMMNEFKAWQNNDGTKEGLMKLINAAKDIKENEIGLNEYLKQDQNSKLTHSNNPKNNKTQKILFEDIFYQGFGSLPKR